MAALLAAQNRPLAALSEKRTGSQQRPASSRLAASARCSVEQRADVEQPGRRQALAGLAAAAAALGLQQRPAMAASDFVQTASGLLVQDIT